MAVVKTAHDESNFEVAYRIILGASIEWVHTQLVKLGKWPAERIPVRVLDRMEATKRIKNRVQAALCLSKALVAIEDEHGNLYLARTPDIVSGIRKAHHVMTDRKVKDAVEGTYGTEVSGDVH